MGEFALAQLYGEYRGAEKAQQKLYALCVSLKSLQMEEHPYAELMAKVLGIGTERGLRGGFVDYYLYVRNEFLEHCRGA